MKLANELMLALRLLWRDHRAGELALIALAIVIAVGSVTTVGFFTDRVQHALGREANQLLGADLVVVSSQPLEPRIEALAREQGLSTVRMMRFPSMAIRGERSALASVKAVTEGYPLRGELRFTDALQGTPRKADRLPQPGTAWVDERLYTQLALTIGERIELGRSFFTVMGIVTHEPDASVGFLNAAPRIIINDADVAATGLVQTGSRIGYRLLVAGTSEAIDTFRSAIANTLQPGQRIEGIRDARPEIRSALDRAEKFLSLAALISVVLAAVAIGLSARRFLQRHLDACAVMRCLGATAAKVVRLYLVHFALLGLAASAIGCALGIAAQAALAYWLGSLVSVELPPAGWLPALYGLVTGLALLLGFALPPLIALGHVPTLRVLRRDLGAPGAGGVLTYVAGYAVIALMILWKAEGLRLGAMVLGGFTAALALVGVLTWLLLKALGTLRVQGVAWRYGVANLHRRPLGSMIQVVALGLGIMALLVLTLVRQDLLHAWRTTLPVDAPNRFIVNIQSDEVPRLRKLLGQRVTPQFHPMVRARLTRINERAVSSADYGDERSRRLIDREFNLSWAQRMQADNRITVGRWWDDSAADAQFSVEEGLAQTLGMKLGDVLTFDVAGTPVSARITSLRHIDWDTFNVNFFVVAPPGMLETHPATYVTSFYLAPGNSALLTSLVREFPGVLLIDIEQVMAQVQRMMDQVARAVQFIFLFTVLAGLTVLYAAIASTQDERLHQTTIMRTLGASRHQLRWAVLAEFAVLGLFAGVLAAAGASGIAYGVATHLLNLPYSLNVSIWLIGAAAGIVGIALAGYAGTRSVLKVGPLKTLREIG
ncbi:MAG: FtsX-like permease family protein [Pseudomonadota bacterium]